MYRVLKKIRLAWPLITLGIFYIYLGFHAFSGDQGILRWADYSDNISELKQEIANLEIAQEKLQIHVDQLRAEQLDLDRLGEEARKTLNVSYANEIVIWLDETP